MRLNIHKDVQNKWNYSYKLAVSFNIKSRFKKFKYIENEKWSWSNDPNWITAKNKDKSVTWFLCFHGCVFLSELQFLWNQTWEVKSVGCLVFIGETGK